MPDFADNQVITRTNKQSIPRPFEAGLPFQPGWINRMMRRRVSPENCGSVICNVCRDLNPKEVFDHFDRYDEDFKKLQEPISRLVKSASNRCRGCCLVLDAIKAYELYDMSSTFSIAFSPTFVLTVTDKCGKSQRLEIYVHEGVPNQSIWPAIIPAREPAVDGGSARCMDLAASWLQHCIKNHPECRRSVASALPTRVLEIGPGSHDLRLFNTNSATGQYATLSHRWGEDTARMKTTTATLRPRTSTIPLSSLSKTFQDAVVITRRLGLKYLWIDSLCIVQDDEADKRAELQNMASIYRNAHFTIASYAPQNSGQGCFDRAENVRNQKICEIPYAAPEPWQETSIHVRECEFAITNGLAHGRSPTVLSSRGWCFQERMLSPRTLHYTLDELVFECVTMRACECQVGTTDPIQQNPFDVNTTRWRNHSESMQLITGRSPQDQILGRWEEVVRQYTRRALGDPDDRLNAIAGVASVVQEMSKARYYAGLWWEDLVFGLMWYSHSDLSPRRLDRIAPTWSWGSVEANVMFSQRQRNSHVLQILDIQPEASFSCQHTLPEPGRSARLTFQAAACDAVFLTENTDGTEDRRFMESQIQRGLQSAYFYPDITLDMDISSGVDRALDNRHSKAPEVLRGGHYYYIICEDQPREIREHGLHLCNGLVLKLVSSTPEMFQRVGMMMTHAQNWSDWKAISKERRFTLV